MKKLHKKKEFANTICSISSYSLNSLMFIIFTFLFICSIIVTCDMLTSNSIHESVIFINDNVILNIIILAFSVGIMFFFRHFLCDIPFSIMVSLVMFFTLIFGLLWITSAKAMPISDSYKVVQAAYLSSHGDYSMLSESYFKYYPFQLGYVFFNEMIFRIFNNEYYFMFIQILNVIFLSVSYFFILLSEKLLFNNKYIDIITSVLMIFCLQSPIFCSFTYGNIPGLMFSCVSIYLFIKTCKKFSWLCLLASGFFAAEAFVIKPNYLITIISISIISILKSIEKKNIKYLVFIIIAFIIGFGTQKICINQYQERTGIDFGKGIPMVSWLCMGINEGPIAPGWFYRKYTISNFENTDMDSSAASEISKLQIKERIDYFSDNPRYTFGFFRNKFLSQWNETTYQSIWITEVRNTEKNYGCIADYVCNEGKSAIKKFMDYFMQFVFGGVVVFFLTTIFKKNKYAKESPELLVIPLIIFGGVLYHILFEAKSQYVIPYLVLMLPLAACGINNFILLIHNMSESLLRIKSKKS
ncbi:MAG: glycosyltransferase family 39 protein [Oscillospiraceae bacterium]|nr:glycosyltransferase family 39 protein [Oscillospiraceae bacterium]